MNHTLKKFLTSVFICCLACTATITIQATQNEIKSIEEKEVNKDSIGSFWLEFEHLEYEKENYIEFCRIFLKSDSEDAYLYQEMIQAINKENTATSLNLFLYRLIKSKDKLQSMKDKISCEIFYDRIPTKYIQLFCKKVEIKNEKRLQKIINKELKPLKSAFFKRKKRNRIQDHHLKLFEKEIAEHPICFTYKITYFPLLFLACKGTTG